MRTFLPLLLNRFVDFFSHLPRLCKFWKIRLFGNQLHLPKITACSHRLKSGNLIFSSLLLFSILTFLTGISPKLTELWRTR
ncbi:hypothetical protein I3842_03G160200 [Carya illinoinensis]|uniref:Uncharacterized protein n=1 Tax=Carya illinoinensis TaxID=32201 RepID=A0A922FLG7_CARIL|nr:hypothetical protein I3842_03G160200 [Carya illinoinensis]